MARCQPFTPIAATEIGPGPVPSKQSMVIGLYGLPGSGKSTLIEGLKLHLDQENFLFYEGSELISSIVTGGLAAFDKLDEEEKRRVRERAIGGVAQECSSRNRSALVAGHYMFWTEGESQGHVVATASDLSVYTHIIYLEVPAPAILQRRLDDIGRCREAASAAHLHRWQRAEIDQLRGLCRHHSIFFSAVPQHSSPLPFTLRLVRHFAQTNASCNNALVESKVEAALVGEERAETVLVVDADKTLASEDAGAMFWKAVDSSLPNKSDVCPLKSLFGSPLGYSEAAFIQATLMYEEAADDVSFEALCDKVSSSITIHPEFIRLFQLACGHGHMRVVVLTCGIRRVWQMVLEKAGFGNSIKVIGSGRIADEVVITPQAKAQVVRSLRKRSGLYVWAFGDSPLDLPMLEGAHRAIIVSGDAQTRSRSMEDALREAIESRGFHCHQVLLPPHAAPRLTATRLPLLSFSDAEFVEELVRRREIEVAATTSKIASACNGAVIHATHSGAAKLLMSPTRDASISGAALRQAHQELGKFLALQLLTEVIGVEAIEVPHVQGHQTTGFRLAHEAQTTIAALMRGGEPMALGIGEVFPKAMFLHTFRPEDIESQHLRDQKNLILVDSVVNSGKSIVEFLRHVTRLKQDGLVNVVVVAGVVQEESVAEGHVLRTMLEQHGVKLVALRLSSNKFTGTKGTDTGNRLFNTTHLA
ncbi:HAD-like domain protein [Cordyceps fumosorosea ARSEF 2679]|uniref:HAD-like domain protein n=1 Tax=Cordyceps fumosorosea (strain ARSEF 2679) TaxID=1081104 RepID=A0A162MSZ2_CORFA|nr:HAD-like domain protein [Cordyceps fumosorosea ARSEF 2679]OAA69839.1 HAD-like domain protein [Cordyceps fumosorosea ARSEF 2679]